MSKQIHTFQKLNSESEQAKIAYHEDDDDDDDDIFKLPLHEVPKVKANKVGHVRPPLRAFPFPKH
jgi:hypothetical protein